MCMNITKTKSYLKMERRKDALYTTMTEHTTLVLNNSK